MSEVAAREIEKPELARHPSTEKLKAELDEISARKTALECYKIQREKRNIALRQNVDALLKRPKE